MTFARLSVRGQQPAEGSRRHGPAAPEHPDGSQPEREAHQAEERRCREPLLPLWTTGHGPSRTGYGAYLRLGGTFIYFFFKSFRGASRVKNFRSVAFNGFMAAK